MSRLGPSLSVVVSKPTISIAEGPTNLVANPGFELSGSPFASWTADTDDGRVTITLAIQAGDFRSGAAGCKMVTVSGGDAVGHVYQDVTVLANTGYHLTFYSKLEDTFASMQGRFAVYDNTNAAWIISREKAWGVSSSAWQQTSRLFRTPHACVSIRIYLYQNIDSNDGLTSYVKYDDVSLVQRLVSPSLVVPSFPSSIEFSGYTHTISADGHYDTMTVSLPTTLDEMEKWLETGLMKFIDVVDDEGNHVWGGFVNEISAQYGATTVTMGPLTDIVNRGRLKYKTLDASVTPAIKGDDMKSVWINDADSQTLFGVMEGIATGGDDTVDNMTQALTVLISDSSWPPRSHNLGYGGGSVLLTLGCKGRVHLLDKFFYYNTGFAGETNLSLKLASVLSSDPNMLIDVNNAYIESNTTQVPNYEDDDRTAKAVINELVELGDSTASSRGRGVSARYLYGFDGDGLFFYRQRPKEIEYFRDVESGEITDVLGGAVPPHRVLPGKWLRQIGSTKDKRGATPSRYNTFDVFIESVSYTMPNTLTLTESKFSTTRKMLANLGVGEF